PLQRGHRVIVLGREGSPLLQLSLNRGLDARSLTAATVRRVSYDVDLVHAHDARSHTIAALLSAAPVIVSRRVSFPPGGGLSRWKYSRPRRFIAVSHHVKEVLVKGGVCSDRISVVYDGVPLLNPSIRTDKIIAPESSDPQKGAVLTAEAARIAGVPIHFSKNLERDLADAGLFVYITQSEGLG